MAKKPLGLALDEDLIRRVDEARGLIPRTRWIEQALERALPDAGPSIVATPAQDREARDDFSANLKKITEGWS